MLGEHLKACPRCQARVADIREDAALSARTAGLLRAEAAVLPMPPAPSAFRSTRPVDMPRQARPRWIQLAAAALVIAAVLVTAIPGLRAAAVAWFRTFTPKGGKVLEVVPSPPQAAQPGVTQEALFGGLIHVEDRTPAQPQHVPCADLSARNPPLPAYLPAGFVMQRCSYAPPGERILRFDVDGINAALAKKGARERLPEELKGQDYRIRVGEGFVIAFGRGSETLLLTAWAPTEVSIAAPVDMNQVWKPILALAEGSDGLPPALSTALQGIDLNDAEWLVVVQGQGQAVQVNAWPAAYSEKVGLQWAPGGARRRLYGALPLEELVRIAESLPD
ncbi:MAG TPA: hypothetical protein VD902_12455 [Symbiobacteriaceae bacterium]|nr:hypothetical protein [Symbiobacteriaceae bacterium]